MTYAQLLTQSLRHEGVGSPERLLAIGIIARWADDLGTRYASPIDESWADMAGVPMDWLRQLERKTA